MIVVRKALLTDVGPLLELINGFASEGIMLPRTEFELAENIRDFTVALNDGIVAGGGALHFYGARTGEVRSLAVGPAHQHLGIGKRLVEALEAEAATHGRRLDEFPAGYSSEGWSPPEPASASPAGSQHTVESSCRSGNFQ